MQQVLALKRADCFKYMRILLKRCQNHRDLLSYIERTVNVFGEDPTKLTLLNASIDRQKPLKHDYIYNI